MFRKASLFALLALLAFPAFGQVKLSQINNGGNLVSTTDQLVGVRSGTTDELLTVGSSCVENLTSIVIDNGSGGLTLGAGQVTNAMLANNSMTLAGHSVALGGTQTFACGDLSNSGTACTAVAPANTTATTSNFFTAYTASTGAFTKAQPAFTDISGQATNAQLATQTANTVLGALTATTPSGLALPSCTDSGGNHLNYTSGTGFSCGTSDANVGTVTSIATTSPITGGTITTTGTIACATCATTTSGGALSGTSPVAVSSGGAISITGAAGQVLAGSTPAFTATPVLGTNASAAGTLGLANGSASGTTITLQNLGNITTGYNWNFPITAGSSGNLLASGGGGSTSETWDTTTGSGTVVALATTPTFVTNITDPLVIGGTTSSSALTLESTSGTGSTDSVIVKTGSQVTSQTWNSNATTTLSAAGIDAQSTPAISTATFTPNFAAGNHFIINLVHASCPCTLANPTNIVAGQSGVIAIVQSSSGSDLVSTYGGDYVFTNSTAATLSTAANAIDYYSYYVESPSVIRMVALTQTNTGAEQTISFQPGLLTSVLGTTGAYGKFVNASTTDNMICSAISLTCATNPTVSLYECGTSATCASPTTIASVQVTATGTATPATISSSAITAGDYVGWAISGGTCTALDIACTAQVHSN